MTPPNDDTMTTGEIGRELARLSLLIGDFITRSDRDLLRKDVYVEAQKVAVEARAADQMVVRGVRTDLDAIVAQQLALRRLLLSGLVLPVLVLIIGAYLIANGAHA